MLCVRERERESIHRWLAVRDGQREALPGFGQSWLVVLKRERERESVRKNPKTPKLVVQRKRQPIMGVFIVVSISITGLGEAELRK